MNLLNILYGLIIGIANIIPGVSGGTMAVILNVYDEIISSVSNISKDFFKSIKYLLPFGIGAGLGILVFSKLIEYTLKNYNMATNMVFVGLIIGSVPMIAKKSVEKKLKLSSIVSFFVCIGFMIFMKVANPEETSSEIITKLDVISFIKIFVVSILSSGAMIIPGISGSFVMLLLGMYPTVLTAISNFNILLLIPVGLGCIVGILGCAKIIEKLFLYFPNQTYNGILGFMIGSIFIIFPEFTYDLEGVISTILMIFSALIAFGFSKK